MGLHTGSVIRYARGYFGRTLILCSRVAEMARGDEILISGSFKQCLEDAGGLRFSDERTVQLKGFSRPETIYRIHWAPRCADDIRLARPPVGQPVHHREQSPCRPRPLRILSSGLC